VLVGQCTYPEANEELADRVTYDYAPLSTGATPKRVYDERFVTSHYGLYKRPWEYPDKMKQNYFAKILKVHTISLHQKGQYVLKMYHLHFHHEG
jgi:hypothetical protein